MGEGRTVYRVLVGKSEGKRPLGRLRRRWEDNIKMDLQENYRAPCVDILVRNESGNNIHPRTSPDYRDEDNKGDIWKDT